MYLLGITSSFDNVGRWMIALDWHPDGHPQTGLWKPCVLKCWWVVRWNSGHIIRILGELDIDTVENATDYLLSYRAEKLANESGN